MAMQNAIQALMSRAQSALGGAPKPAAVGTPPPANPNAAPHPYDVAGDPAWKNIIDVADHAFRNFLNGLDPDNREMLRQKLSGSAQPATPPPDNPVQKLFSPGFGSQPPQ